MIQGKTVIAIIPARGGSKGVPRKNIRILAGKPLIAWTIEEAKKSRYIDRLILSSENEEIIQVAKEWNCEVPFVRPMKLAMDDTPGIEPILHAINALKKKYDYGVYLQPTSPLRSIKDIDGCIEACVFTKSPSCVSVTEVRQHPYWMYKIDELGCLVPFLKEDKRYAFRQDLPPLYVLNGAVYVAECTFLNNNHSFFSDKTKAYIMSTENSIDVDFELDFKILESLILNKSAL